MSTMFNEEILQAVSDMLDKKLEPLANKINSLESKITHTSELLQKIIPILDEMADDAFCEQMYQNYLNSSDDDKQAMPSEEFMRVLNNVPEDDPTPDEIQAIADTNEDIKNNGVVSYDDIDWD